MKTYSKIQKYKPRACSWTFLLEKVCNMKGDIYVQRVFCVSIVLNDIVQLALEMN